MKSTLKTCFILFSCFILFLSFTNLGVEEQLNKIKLFFEENINKYNQEKLYIQLDKTFYKPGETIWVNSFLTNAVTHKIGGASDIVYIELIQPSGKVVQTLKLSSNSGISKGNFDLDNSITGGIFKIRGYTLWMLNFGKDAIFEKELIVQKIIPARLLFTVDFLKKAYGPGDWVEANIKIKNINTDLFSNKEIYFEASIDGQKYISKDTFTNEIGTALIRFKLPTELNSTDGLLNITTMQDGTREAISRSIPIVLNKIDLQFMPEGGSMVPDISQQIGFKAINEFGKAADIEGEIFDKQGKIITSFTSFHMGMGSFYLICKKNEKYFARITKPKGIKEIFKLPEIENDKQLLSVKSSNDSLEIQINSSQKKNLICIIEIRKKVFYSKSILTEENYSSFKVPIKDMPSGIAHVCLYDDKNIEKPENERLVFVNYNKQMTIDVKTDKSVYKPREEVKMTITTKDEKGNPVDGFLALSVVDDKIISTADDRQDNILSHLLISSELKGKVEEPNYYFKKEEPNAEKALDYLLLTQGWVNYKRIEKEYHIVFEPESYSMIQGVVSSNFKRFHPKRRVYLIETDEGSRDIKIIKTDKQGNFKFNNVNRDKNYALFVLNNSFLNENLSLNYNENLLDQKSIDDRKLLLNNNLPDFINTDIKKDLKSIDIETLIADNDRNLSSCEVISYGYGNQTRSDLTGSISRINEGIQVRTAGILTSMQQLAGINVQGGSVMVRGRSSITAGSDPLYVIDGIPVNSIGGIKSVNELNPNQIYSIQILKDPASTIKYGALGANGVILITTKNKDYSYYYDDYPALICKVVPSINLSKVKGFYSPKYDSPDLNESRKDFRTTIYWNPSIHTGPNGVTEVSFYNSDEVTKFRTIVEGISKNGDLGRTEHTYFTTLPFTLDIKIPSYLTFGDNANLQLVIKNNTNQVQTGNLICLLPSFAKSETNKDTILTVQANESLVYPITFDVIKMAGKGNIDISFKTDVFKDAIKREIEIQSKGFPVTKSFSDASSMNEFNFICNNYIKGSMKASIVVYYNLLTDLETGLESMIHEPHGCFEQVSSSNYPNIMILEYMNKYHKNNQQLREKAIDFIKDGYKKLVAYEIKGGGFEWFGHEPANESLTAYGLLQFNDLKNVCDFVDSKMMQRTQKWLLDKRTGKGTFVQDPGKYGFSYIPSEVHNAYLVYALSETGITDIQKEFEASFNECTNSKNPYRIALIANAAINLKENSKANLLLILFDELIKEYGISKLPVGKTITHSGTQEAQVEALSLYLLAILKSENPDKFQPTNIYISLMKLRRNYGFGSTQATVLALKALLSYNEYKVMSKYTCDVSMHWNDQEVFDMNLTSNQLKDYEIFNPEKYISSKEQKIKIEYSNDSCRLPFNLNINYITTLPEIDKDCKISLFTRLKESQVRVGDNVRMDIELTNKTSEILPMSVCVVGIPSGLSIQSWQIKEMNEKRQADFIEIYKNYIVFYFTNLYREKNVIHLDLKAEVPGTYTAPAGSAYLYYSSNSKYWIEGETITIVK